MGLLGDSVKGVAVGFGAVLGLGLVASMAGRGGRGRPLAKGLLNGLLNARDWLYEAGAEGKEQLNDLMAEVRAERAASGETVQPESNGRRTRRSMPSRRRTAASARTAG